MGWLHLSHMLIGSSACRSLADANQDPHSNGGSHDAQMMALSSGDIESDRLIDYPRNHPLIIALRNC